MLGHLVKDYLLSSPDVTIKTINHRWPSENFKSSVKSAEVDIVINCIGAIPQKTKDFSVNIELPIWLENNVSKSTKIIHPGTDCEIDDDDYGNSKREASEYIQRNSTRTKIIQTSIIGPELFSSAGLFSWFMSSTGSVNGWTTHLWNGNTTLEWAHRCLDMIKNWEKYDILTVIQGETVSKYEILSLIQETFEKDIEINAVETSSVVNKCLEGELKTAPLKEQLLELKKYMIERKTKYDQYFTP